MTRIVVIGKANTITAQLERIQRMGLVPSGPRIVSNADAVTAGSRPTRELSSVATKDPHRAAVPSVLTAAAHFRQEDMP